MRRKIEEDFLNRKEEKQTKTEMFSSQIRSNNQKKKKKLREKSSRQILFLR